MDKPRYSYEQFKRMSYEQLNTLAAANRIEQDLEHAAAAITKSAPKRKQTAMEILADQVFQSVKGYVDARIEKVKREMGSRS